MYEKFIEVQRFRQLWFWGVLIFLSVVMSVTLYFGILKYISDGNLLNIVILIFVSFIELLVTSLLI